MILMMLLLILWYWWRIYKNWRLHEKEKMKYVCVKEIADIAMNEEKNYDFMRNETYYYLALTKDLWSYAKITTTVKLKYLKILNLLLTMTQMIMNKYL